MITVTERIKALASFINCGERVADIGTDHGFLPIYLRENGISPFVIASDIREKPLKNALANIRKYGVTNIEARLCDGLFGLSPCEIDAVVIAGMGGECIAGILDDCDWAKNSGKHFVLQPMNSPEVLRNYLRTNGYSVINEKAVICLKKCYTVLDCIAKSDSENYPPMFDYVGKLDRNNKADRMYLEKQYARIDDCAEQLKSVAGKEEEYKEQRRIADFIKEYIGK